MSFYSVKPGMRGPSRLALSWLLLAVGGCTSTGVGNPAPALTLSLSLVNDDAADAGDMSAAGAASATGEAGAAGDTNASADDVGVGGADSGLAGASDGAAGDSAASAGAASVGAAGSPGTDLPPPAQPLPVGAIRDAVIVLGKLHFMPCDPTRGSVFSVEGPFVVDLKHHTTRPEIPDIAGTPGGYCGIDAPLAAATAPAALAGRSVFFDGYRADGTFFIVYANMVATLRMRAKDGAKWQGMEPPPRFFWALHPRRWLLTAELNAADTTSYENHPRAVVIDADRHAALFLLLRARIAGISKMYADANGDGVFDAPDREAEVGEGLDNAD